MKKLISVFFVILAILYTGIICYAEETYEKYSDSAEKALNALSLKLKEESSSLWVYKEFGDTENHFTQKAMMWGNDKGLIHAMDENYQDEPHSGESCIRCEQETVYGDWGGWMFINGYLEQGSSVPIINNGISGGQGLDLTGAEKLKFWAKGEEGGETVEFFTCGFGYDGSTNRPTVDYPDSSQKKTLGYISLSDCWEEYDIDLGSADMSYIVCGFGFVLSGDKSGSGTSVFFLDDIHFTGSFSYGDQTNYLLRSYETDNNYIKNAAYTYDNALAAMAFISADRPAEAKELLDSFVYAVNNDRYFTGGIRNAYAAGDITSFPGWNNAARLPGWYDKDSGVWHEDQYQVGSNVGNTSYAALALLQYDAVYGSEIYRNTAAQLMDWVTDFCGSDTPGFTGGYDGWQESGKETTYVFTYKSIEHNIDAYAAFLRLFELTGESRYMDAAGSALSFIRSMYDNDKKYFYTGTGDDGITPSKDNIVLDAQVWACMSLREEFTPYMDSLSIVEQMENEEGAYPFCAANRNGGWWAEGTAYTALMYRLIGNDEKASAAMDALAAIQQDNGLFPAATVDNLSTGFELFNGNAWEYNTDAHIAPTAWFILAYNSFNPYSF